MVQKIFASKHLRCRPTPRFHSSKFGSTARRAVRREFSGNTESKSFPGPCGGGQIEPGPGEYHLKVESEFRRQRARRDIVCPAERGQVVVQRFFVRHVDYGEPRAPFVAVAMEEVVFAQGQIKQVARLDALRIVVVVLGVRSRYLEVYGSERACGAGGKRCRAMPRRQRVGSDQLTVAGQPGLVRLIGGQSPSGDGVDQSDLVTRKSSSRARCRCRQAWSCTGHQSAVISPVEAEPRPGLPRLVLNMGCLVELLVVVNAEDADRGANDWHTGNR